MRHVGKILLARDLPGLIRRKNFPRRVPPIGRVEQVVAAAKIKASRGAAFLPGAANAHQHAAKIKANQSNLRFAHELRLEETSSRSGVARFAIDLTPLLKELAQDCAAFIRQNAADH